MSTIGENIVIIQAVNKSKVIFRTFAPLCSTMYQIIHIIAALTTGAHNHTKYVKATILIITPILLTIGGKNEKRKLIKIIHSVILNPLTAIKCVRPELLKSSFKSLGIFSRAQNKIPQRKIASVCGYLLSIILSNFCLLIYRLYL